MPGTPSPQAIEALRQAQAAHAARDVATASAAYRTYLETMPADVEARFALGVLLLESGDLATGAVEMNEMRRIAPQDPRPSHALGMVRRHMGDDANAETFFREAIERAPDYAPALTELGNLLSDRGETEAAETSFRAALAASPDDLTALTGLAMVLSASGRATDALEYFRRAHALQPDQPALSFNLARALREADLAEEARAQYETLLAAHPGLAPAWYNFGNLLLDLGCVEEALDAYGHSTALKFGPIDGRGGGPAGGDRMFTHTTAFKLKHDIEQFEYLARNDIEAAAFSALAEEYRALAGALPPPGAGGYIFPLPEDTTPSVRRVYNREIHIAKTPAFPDGALNPDLDFAAIETAYAANGPGYYVLDDLLRPEALAELRRFCLESTIWHSFDRRGGYLGAFMSSGFDSPLLRQIARELRESLSGIFLHHTLRKMWAYKYDSDMSGIPTHADFAAVNVNFWITPDEALVDPAGGGLRFYTAEAPLDWNFEKFNADDAGIADFLASTPHEVIDVPYKANRAVIFNSNLFHKSGELTFRDGYENRRINVTLLYGKRGK